MAMHAEARALLDRVTAQLQAARDLTRSADWVAKNTAHPKKFPAPWTFEGHEFQVGIMNDSRPKGSIRKCSQVGMSEVSVRLMLALLSIYQGYTGIYTLPTTGFARKFAKSRIDPVISKSAVLRPMVPTEVDSSELKQIGDSFLYITGTYGQVSAISVPGDILFKDEVDFSNPVVLSTFSSRLGHAEGGGVDREFSTPTVHGYGISESFEQSSQAYYMVKCDKCGSWELPDFYQDIVIPGFDQSIVEFDKAALRDPQVRADDAYIRCPRCHHPLSAANLTDPAKRQWVEKVENKDHGGWQVYPWDVYAVNPIARTLKYVNDYERLADWVNFKVGLPFEDAETAFVPDVVKAMFQLQHVPARRGAATGCVMGVDVGKTSHLLIGKRMSPTRFDLLHAERITQTSEGRLVDRILELADWFGVSKLVIDAMPDFSTPLYVISRLPMGQAYACYYMNNPNKKELDDLRADPDTGVVHAFRTGTFDTTVKAVNTGQVVAAQLDAAERKEFEDHLGAMKRVNKESASGERVASWVAVKADHYAHALNYLMIADQLCDEKYGSGSVACLPHAAKVRMKS